MIFNKTSAVGYVVQVALLDYVFVSLGEDGRAAELFDEALQDDSAASPYVLADAAFAFLRAPFRCAKNFYNLKFCPIVKIGLL